MAKKYQKHYNGNTKDALQFKTEDYGLKQVYSADDVKNCAICFNKLATLLQKSKLQMIVQKYKHTQYYEVSRIVASVLKINERKDPAHTRGNSLGEYQSGA